MYVSIWLRIFQMWEKWAKTMCCYVKSVCLGTYPIRESKTTTISSGWIRLWCEDHSCMIWCLWIENGVGVSYSLLGTMKEMFSIKLFYRYLCVQESSSPNWFPFQTCWRQMTLTHWHPTGWPIGHTDTRKLLHCPVSYTDSECLLQTYIWSPLCCDQISSRQGKDKLAELICQITFRVKGHPYKMCAMGCHTRLWLIYSI